VIDAPVALKPEGIFIDENSSNGDGFSYVTLQFCGENSSDIMGVFRRPDGDGFLYVTLQAAPNMRRAYEAKGYEFIGYIPAMPVAESSDISK
jgi:hypothetical protein